MADTIIWLAAIPALLSVICGDRAALALWASLLATYVLPEFHPLVWAGLDVLVCLALIRPAMPPRNGLIVALFLPAWGAYFLPDPWCAWIPCLIVAAQFLLTTPAINPDRLRERSTAARGQWRDFDLRVRA